MNKNVLHVYAIPEDEKDRQLADGFCLHDSVDHRRIQVMPPVGGWRKVLQKFIDEYIQILRRYPVAHVVMIIDFDKHFESRRALFEKQIPADLKTRVFVLGSRDEPETLKSALKIGLEQIGRRLANDCDQGTSLVWDDEQLRHNDADRQRLNQTVKPFLLKSRTQTGNHD